MQKEIRKKLDSHSIPATFLGYCEQSKAYRLLHNQNKNIIISRDVVFNANLLNYQSIVENKEKELIDFSFLTIPPIMSTKNQPNINTNSSF